MESTAKLRHARVSAQKARLVADLVRGRDVSEAIEILTFTQKKSAPLIRKLVESAVANAEHRAEATGEDGGRAAVRAGSAVGDSDIPVEQPASTSNTTRREAASRPWSVRLSPCSLTVFSSR